MKRSGVFTSFILFSGLLTFQISPSNAQEIIRVADKRMAAHHYSVVCTGGEIPSSAVLTYPVYISNVQEYNFLLKLMPGLQMDGNVIYPSDFENVRVENFPGGVEAAFHYQNTEVITRLTPLLTGRGSDIWRGAVLYEVKTNPATEVLIYLGGDKQINLIWGYDASIMNTDSVKALQDVRRLDEHTLQFLGGKENLHVGVKSSGTISLENSSSHSQHAVVSMPEGAGHILTGFSEDKDDLAGLMEMDVCTEIERFSEYYKELMQPSIETPDEVMNQAFESAIYNLEYSWMEPFGWGECLHHWLALWYMQVTAGADWIGQTDRSRSSILEHAVKQFDNGAIPMFNPNHLKLGKRRHDWGGANNFWVWQVRHYVNYTGDREFAEQIIPYVDRTINQTLEEYDPDGDLMIAWGLQIGNQEDFVANPYNGAVPTMELYTMFMTRAELSEFTGDSAGSSLWFRKAEQVKKVLYRELWQKDLGRFAYYQDPAGRTTLEGQYQSFLYPVIYDLVDSYDGYSGMRHLRDRLTDTNGAVFASNNFPWHVPDDVSTWGMQRGAAQQPWAAMGYSKAGLNNQTWLPLKAMADWAQDPRRSGAWPETGPEATPAYFTPPAGLYISSTVEALFGLTVNAPKGYIEIAPSFPDHWPAAKLNLPDFQVDYSRNTNRVRYVLNTTKDLPLKILWRLPVSHLKKCTINGREANYRILPGTGHIILATEAPATGKTILEFEFEPLDYKVSVPSSIAEGETIQIGIEGATLYGISDRNGVLESIRNIKPDGASVRVRSGLLKPYLKYNQLGQLNFSRRTFFLDCESPDGVPFIEPVDLCILPRLQAAPADALRKDDNGRTLPLTIRNNTGKIIKGEALFQIENNAIPIPLKVSARSEISLEIDIPSGMELPAGDNMTTLTLPGEEPVEITFANPRRSGSSTFVQVELPAEEMIPDTLWNTLRVMPGFPHIFFTFSSYGWPHPMWALEDVKEVSVEQIPELTFQIPGRHFIPVSHRSGKVSHKLELENQTYRKLYLLVLPLVDNHDIFSEVARVTAYPGNKAVYSRTLSYPGDLDYWVPDKNPTSFSTVREPRPNRFEMLSLLEAETGDWEAGRPPAFPQSRWWSTSHPIVTESCVMNVIEINLAKAMELDYLVFESLGALPAFGIVALTAEVSE